MTRALIVTGGGGVGKTTLSAAIAVSAAAAGARTLVITVDPAKRLGDAFGIEELGNHPAPVAGAPNLAAAMLDAAASWEALVIEHAAPDVAERLLPNPFFRAIADRFASGQSFAAADQMTRHIQSKAWDLVVVDTPPAGGGIDFFNAPGQMRSIVGGRVLRWATGSRIPGRRRIYALTTKPMLRLADSVLGSALLEDVAEFLMDLRSMYDGLSKRAKTIERALKRASILVVTTADPSPVREAGRFFEQLPETAGAPFGVVFNRALPQGWAGRPKPPALTGAHKTAVVANLARWGAEAQRQRDAREGFAAIHRTKLAYVSWLAESPVGLDGLRDLIKNAEGLADLLGD